ncbi:hypothetical protein F4819DRAFT_470365 [Hypoxylon fuscum]|nr:hypothetical protein F4819DRAFT_470365 [Hypoxylon fuscum]
MNRNRDILRIQGFHTQATGATLAALAAKDEEWPAHKEVCHQATFEPFYFFFYGSLQDPSVLKSVCGLKNPFIRLKPASIKDWRGKYPPEALVAPPSLFGQITPLCVRL